MAKAVVVPEENGTASRFDETDYFNSKVVSPKRRTKIEGERNKLKSVNSKDYPIARIRENDRLTRVEEVLPFRVRFVNLGISEIYGPNNPAPVGIAVVGFNNYIL